MAEYPAPILRPPCDSRTTAVICYALAAVLLVFGGTVGWFGRGCVTVKPTVVATTAETTYTTVNDTTTITTVAYKPDPKAAARIAELTAQLDGTNKSLGDLLSYVSDLQGENAVLVDSFTFWKLNAAAKMLDVRYDRGAIRTTTLDRKTVAVYATRAWGPKWTLYADGPNGKPRLVQPRFPFVIGVEGELRGSTAYDTLAPAVGVAAHVTATRGAWTWFVGTAWPVVGDAIANGPKVEAGLRLGWSF
jgi:hypothetical protein